MIREEQDTFPGLIVNEPQDLTRDYRVTAVVTHLGCVDFDSDVPSSCLAAQPVLPKSHLSKQNQAANGT